ncbi:MAG: hypothetical protein Kow0042_29120 [Calditrichia bacterium]
MKNKGISPQILLFIRFSIAVIMSALVVSVVISCAAGTSYTQIERGYRTGELSCIRSEFDRMWDQRTIRVPDGSAGMGGAPFMFPGMPTGRPQFGGFELTIQATLIDSAVVESGLNKFAQLADLTAREKEAFATRYAAEHYLGQYLFIWAEISTPFSEEYLKLDRWTFFLETESGQQLEPEKVIEHPQSPNRFVTGGMADSTVERFPSSPFSRRPLPVKIVEFYFPLTDYDGIPLLTETAKKLKFGVVNSRKMEDRAEGIWDLNKIRSFNP